MTRKSCAVGMRNAILRNHLNTVQTLATLLLKWMFTENCYRLKTLKSPSPFELFQLCRQFRLRCLFIKQNWWEFQNCICLGVFFNCVLLQKQLIILPDQILARLCWKTLSCAWSLCHRYLVHVSRNAKSLCLSH